ncbi:MAG: glycosyltransferase, partial [Faecalibacillus sp.]
MKILYVATVRSHIGQFHMPFIKHLCQNGHIVDAAFKDNSNDKKGLDLSALNRTFEVPFERNPFKFNNIKAYFILKKIINEGNYDIIHCHTPMGAAITRLAAKNVRKKGTKIFYTAHGFHFYEGASKKNWLLFYPIEKWLSRYTDCLILINNEDYKLAINKNFKAKKIKKINGVGVELSKFNHNLCNKKNQLREQYGYNQDMFSLIYPADLSIRKNQIMLLDTINLLKNKIPNIKLLLPGQPILKKEYEEYCIKNGIQD